ncbi:unnamed protein product [Ambrosiozyma monospora]|uniref:Unnamed protein product n=1 Tax=Ambrosiozyma monospora TaxID=43982 RepID=A0ACB5SYM2_AMBMO|nr:unnamed protein product [Ambrosiozyma monospora]
METKRINSKISPFERIFIQIVNVVLSTKLTRLLFVGYCLLLHLLVMIMTITMVGGDSTTTTASTSAVAAASNKMSGTTGGIANGIGNGGKNI